MVRRLLFWAVLLWPGLAGAVLCPNGQFVNGTDPQVCTTPTGCAYGQLGLGNIAVGQNTPYATNTFVIQETYPVGGKIVHLSCKTITSGTCQTPPAFNVYVYHSGQTNGTALTCSGTVQAGANNVSSQVENMTFVAGDEVGTFVSTGATGCNAPLFDVDMLIGVGSGC